MLLQRLRIRTRLGCGFGAVLALLVVIAITGYWGASSISKVTMRMLNHDSKMSDTFAIARAIALELRRYEKNIFIRIGSTDERAKKDFPKWAEQCTKLQERIGELEKIAVEPEDREAIKKIKDGLAQYIAGFTAVHAQIKEGRIKDAQQGDAALGGYRDIMNSVNSITAESANRWHEKMQENKQKIVKTNQRIILILAIFGLLAIAGGFMATVLITHSIVSQLEHMFAKLQSITHGENNATNLCVRLSDAASDEISELGRWINSFIDKIQGTISLVAQSSAHVTSAANKFHSTSGQIATGAEELAAKADTVATAGEEMSATATEIAKNCIMAAEGSKQAKDLAVNGADVVQETITVMNRIAEQVRESAKTVESLGARSDEIGEIVGTIEDIADQTNLLALNAAIEAARAGEQGRGFAVVADEVRALAERTTKATKEIGTMIKAIQQETIGAVSAMEKGVSEVETGTCNAARSGEALKEILEQINTLAMQVNQIATAAEEQTATTGEISNNIQQISSVVQDTAKGAQESACAASELANLSEGLQRQVGQFKLSA